MKKRIAILMAALMLLCIGVAAEEPVSSPVAPTVVLNDTQPTEDVELPEDFSVAVVEEENLPESVVTLHEEIEAMVTEGKNIVEMYTEEEQQAMSEILPEEYDLTKLQISEYIPMTVTGYTEEVGDFNVVLEVPGKYAEEDVVIAMFGQIVAGDAETEETIKWTPLLVQVIEGKLQVTFDQETMSLLESQETVLVILKEF